MVQKKKKKEEISKKDGNGNKYRSASHQLRCTAAFLSHVKVVQFSTHTHTHSHAQSVTFNSPAITANPHIHIRENRKYMKVNTEMNFSDLHSNDL